MHGQSTIWINSAVAYDVDSWTLTITNDVEGGPLRRKAGVTLGVAGYQIAGRRTIELELTRVNRTDVMNQAIREANTISFETVWQHPLGYVMQIQLPVLHVESSDEDGTPSRVAKENPRLTAIADALGSAIYYGVDLGPGATTMEPMTTTSTEEPTTTTTSAP
jgi:hypothetical protein